MTEESEQYRRDEGHQHDARVYDGIPGSKLYIAAVPALRSSVPIPI